MKPDEIKKALGHCEFDNCSGCPLAGIGECYNIAVKEALNYINKLESEVESIQQQVYAVYADLSKIIKNQRTEIDGLTMDNERLQNDIVNANCNYEKIKEDCELLKTALAQKIVSEIKSEAIKEFAEKVKLKFYEEFDELIPSIMADEIDNLTKEMVGEK